MRVSIRPSVPTDAEDIIEVLAAAGLKPNVELEALDWKYWAPREDFTGPRSFVATRGTRILAHAAVVPGVYATGSRRVSVLHLIDWAARADTAGVGVSLMKHIGRIVDALLAIGGSEPTRQILPHIGFQLCGAVEGYARVLHPLRSIGMYSPASWKFPAKLARRGLWRFSAPLVAPTGWSIRRISSNEIPTLADTLPRTINGMGVFERCEELFRYMLRCPIVPMKLYSLIRNNQPVGYFLLAFAPGQARLADCWVPTDEPATWHALLQCAALEAWRHRDCAELAAWSSDAVMAQALLASGFHRRNNQPIFMRWGAAEPVSSGPMRIQMLENDAAYIHPGFTELWA